MPTPTLPTQILDQHVAVLGKTRSGKTNSVKLCIEQVAAGGSRVCIIDPIKADYWGLTSSADGKRPGLPFHIIGGQRGHVPLHASAGATLAEVVASGALRLAIIDMEQFGPREAGPFFAAFMEKLFHKIVGVLYLVVDEAHLFAPKDGRGGDESMATYWFKRMASGSGSKGVRLIVSTQRVQELHNTVLSNCDTVIAHRVTFPEDQKRIAGWVASHSKAVAADVQKTLPNMNRGEAWICSGEAGIFERRQLPLCATYDNSRTPTESDEQRAVATAQIDQDKLRAIIGDAVQQAEANDPTRLKQRIADLELQLAKRPAAAPPPPPRVEYRDRPVLTEEHIAALDAANARAHESIQALQAAAGSIERAAASGMLRDHHAPPSPPPIYMLNETHVPKHRARRAHTQADGEIGPEERAMEAAGARAHMPKGELAVLTAIGQYPNGVTREQLTVLTGYKKSARDTYLSRLRTQDMIETGADPHSYRLTLAGKARLGPNFQPLPTGDALRRQLLAPGGLPVGEAAILKRAIASYPRHESREHISEMTGYRKSARDTYLSRLRARQLVTVSKAGVRAADILFQD